MSKMKNTLWGHMAAIFCILVWGSTMVSTKMLLQSFSPTEILFFRFAIGYVVLWMLYPKQMKVNGERHELGFFLCGVTGVTLYFLLQHIALLYTYSANISVIVALAPMFTALLAHKFIKEESMGKSAWDDFFIAMVGVAMVCFGNGQGLKINLLGDGLTIVAAFLWGIYSIIMQQLNQSGYPVLGSTRRVFFYGLISMIPILLFTGTEIHFTALLELANLLNILYIGVVASAVCYLTWNTVFSLLGVVKTNMYLYALPLVTTIMAKMVLNEPITMISSIGIVLTIVGLCLAERKGEKKLYEC
ncbi:DMT family transporter [Sporomusa termitida]|uniref:2A78: carboxylate/amino acid/amine transporter n=1 Tax=Sporomusa termitida TaxID=2377 RepID=A0A517DV16_9FIRM|nr:DMT family transporter [Sporomusa termitida]QDR81209.1 2A78: carboxylate/amino acid/amine transporter [Sporomusa termitida]